MLLTLLGNFQHTEPQEVVSIRKHVLIFIGLLYGANSETSSTKRHKFVTFED